MALEAILCHFSEALQKVANNQESLHQEQIQTKEGVWMVAKKLESIKFNQEEMMKEQRELLEEIRDSQNDS